MFDSLPEYLRPKGDSGQVQLDPLFLYADKLTAADLLEDKWAYSGVSDSERHRLVEGSKSPTTGLTQFQESDLISVAKQKANARIDKLRRDHNAEVRHIDHIDGDDVYQPGRQETPHNAKGVKVVFERRDWSDEYRVRPEVEAHSQPPEQSGSRESLMLSYRGAKKIAESCAYVATEREGFTTFVTLTFNEEKRAQIEAGELTIQKEASRMFDAWQKVYQRGMPTEGIPASSGKLDYIWVVEIPENEQGEKNPHLHVLMRWAVPYEKFKPWAARLEKLWGHGFAHLEKIDDPQAAGAYMAKAAGYITKANGQADQGEVRGNRYGISASARAPEWEKLGEYQLHIMGQLIADIYDHLTELHGADFKERKALNDTRDALLKIGRKEQAESPENRYPIKIKEAREQLGEQLAGVRKRIKSTPIRAQGKYQVIIKGKYNFAVFMDWAKSKLRGEHHPDWLPEKPEGAAYDEGQQFTHGQNKYIADLRHSQEIMKRHRWGRIRKASAVCNEVGSQIVEYIEQCKNWAMDLVSWGEYEALAQ